MKINSQNNQSKQNYSNQNMINDQNSTKPDLNIPAERKNFKKIRGSKKAGQSQTLKYALTGVLILVLTASVFYIIRKRTEPVPTAPESYPEALESQPCTLEFSIVSPTPTPTPTGEPSVTPTLTPTATPTATPTPTRTPSVTPTMTPTITPTLTPTITPSLTPTPTDTPIPAQCTDISALDIYGNSINSGSQIAQDTEMQFLCQATDPDSLIGGYQFRVLLDESGDNAYQTYTPQPPYPEFGNIVDATTDGNTERAYSDFITLSPAGSYLAQCRICSDKNNVSTCQAWEDIDGTIASDPLCDTCACAGSAYETISCNGDTVYVDCNTDTCWAPTTDQYNWNDAMDYCNNLNYGGSNSWILPDRNTLDNLCNSDSCYETCFGGDGPVGGANPYWSSTEYYSWGARRVSFRDGGVCLNSALDKSYNSYVRCVQQ